MRSDCEASTADTRPLALAGRKEAAFDFDFEGLADFDDVLEGFDRLGGMALSTTIVLVVGERKWRDSHRRRLETGDRSRGVYVLKSMRDRQHILHSLQVCGTGANIQDRVYQIFVRSRDRRLLARHIV